MFEIRHTVYIAPNLITDIHIWTHQICSMYLSKDALILVVGSKRLVKKLPLEQKAIC